MRIPKVVAEIGDNHGGSIDYAKAHIRKAAECGASYAKFQKRNVETAYDQAQLDKPYGPDLVWYSKALNGGTYRDHRAALEFSIDQHADLKHYAEGCGIGWSASVWDIISAREVISLNPDYIKVPSLHNNNEKLIKVLVEEYDGPIHVSLGMTTKRERDQIWDWFDNPQRLVLYSCVASYPTVPGDVFANDLYELVGVAGGVGFSGHWAGIAIDLWAVVYGCDYLERHFMLDHTTAGPDVAVSLEPGQLKKLIENLEVFAAAGGSRSYDDYLECEKPFARKYGRLK